MLPHPIREIVIVGGGSAGWMTASYLRKTLNPNVKITQVESPKVGTIGVGEGTIPIVRDFVAALELDQRDWMTACEATFKLGVRFDNWHTGRDMWWHPFFFQHPLHDEKQLVDSWLAHRQAGVQRFEDLASLQDYCMSWQLAHEHRCPRFRASFGSFENWNSDHAFHLDATRFGEYLRDRIAIPAGVQHVFAHIQQVEVDETGNIRSLVTQDGKTIVGDFFIDCTGFRRLLIGQLSEPMFRSYRRELLCDRAIALPVPYEDVWAEMRPYTLSSALSAGWVWQIGLFHRIGMGYVYSSQFLDETQAEDEFRTFIGPHRVANVEANHVRFESGCLETPWVKNCVALGLAEGFVEPLEATALGVTQHHIRKVGERLAGPLTHEQIDVYNRESREIYEQIKHFLVSHYCLTRRTDAPFWREVAMLDSPLRTIRDRGLETIPADEVGTRVFATQSWLCLAAGFDCLPTGSGQSATPPPLALADMERARNSQQRVLDGFVRQYTFLQSLRGNS